MKRQQNTCSVAGPPIQPSPDTCAPLCCDIWPAAHNTCTLQLTKKQYENIFFNKQLSNKLIKQVKVVLVQLLTTVDLLVNASRKIRKASQQKNAQSNL